MKRSKSVACLVASWLAAATLLAAPQQKVRATGLFSDMHWVEEAGDVVGMEVLIVYSTSGLDGRFWAYVQIAEGSPSAPVLVEAKITGQKVEFTLPKSTGQLGRFVGIASDKALVGRFEGSNGEVRLPRRKSYWQ